MILTCNTPIVRFMLYRTIMAVGVVATAEAVAGAMEVVVEGGTRTVEAEVVATEAEVEDHQHQ